LFIVISSFGNFVEVVIIVVNFIFSLATQIYFAFSNLAIAWRMIPVVSRTKEGRNWFELVQCLLTLWSRFSYFFGCIFVRIQLRHATTFFLDLWQSSIFHSEQSIFVYHDWMNATNKGGYFSLLLPSDC